MDLVGESVGMRAVRDAIRQVARTNSTVLILGETGVGKELVARSIHESSRRAMHAFVPVSGVALAPGLVTSELFGHEIGSFTGATKRRIGRFEQANGGTLFLDEIGELSSETQALLLRALQERKIERVGGDPVDVDIRLVAATNRNLRAEVNANRFRADLFFRLNVFPITVPPLRERKDDLPDLVETLLNRLCHREQRPRPAVSTSILQMFARHDWPGNVRELANVLERGLIVSEERLIIDPAWLVGASIVETAVTWAAQEKQRILDALHVTQGRVYGPGGAAHRLGLNPTTLYGKMKKHGITKRDQQS